MPENPHPLCLSGHAYMRVIFAGTPEFAATALGALIAAKHEVLLVLTQPDRPAGRGMKEMPSAVKQLALKNDIEVFQPLTLKSPDAQARIAAVNSDVMIVAAYGLILPQAVLDMPKHGCINIHAAPIHRAILAGDQETGITIMQMEAGLDTGPMLLVGKTPIAADDTTATLHDKLAALGAELIVEALAKLEKNQLPATPQPGAGVTYAEKILKQEAVIDWNLTAQEIERRIRALQPFPVTQTPWRGEALKIWRAKCVADEAGAPGALRIIDTNRLIVGCGVGALEILELQRPGGKRLSTKEFLAGNKFVADERFGT
jgi:methionyl-tRNA formyltransferase